MQNNNNLLFTINRIIKVLNNNFKSKIKTLKYEDILMLFTDLNKMLDQYASINHEKCSEIAIKKYIPLLKLICSIDKNQKSLIEYEKMLKNAYRLAGRNSFEHFVVYYEWNLPWKDKFFLPRYEILSGYAHFLNEMTFDRVDLIIANLPSGTGKTYLEKLSEAFDFGQHPEGTILSLCSNDTVVKGSSKLVRNIIMSEEFGEVFPNLKYEKSDKDFFTKTTDGEWTLRDCKLLASYYASTTNSNVVGQRASRRIHIDDLYADYLEALNENLNSYYENKYKTVWKKRFVQGYKPKISITGTMWSPTDFMVRMIDLLEKENKFIPHEKYKYCRISEDRRKVIIQVPAMDYETGETTCKALWSTEELEAEKNSMEEYLWQCNFQQVVCSPEGLEFSYPNLKTYTNKPINESGYCKAYIDGTRKNAKDNFSMPIFQPYFDDWALVDCIYTKTATTELYEDIVDKIIQNNIIYVLVESNVDNGLKKELDRRLQQRGIFNCTVEAIYNTMPKAQRIARGKGIALRKIVYPEKDLYPMNTQMGRFMNDFTSFNTGGRNAHDDAPESICEFAWEIIDEQHKTTNKIKPIKKPF